MAVIVYTTAPEALLDKLKTKIENQDIESWKLDKYRDLIHTDASWSELAWFRPQVYDELDRLVFNIVTSPSHLLGTKTYAFFHAQLIQTLLFHCDENFTQVRATAALSKNDKA